MAQALTPGRLLLGILVIYLVWSAIYAALTPPWESPDEPSHYLYVRYLAEHGTQPAPAPFQEPWPFYANGFVTSLYEGHHPLLGYVPHAIVYRVWSIFDLQGLPQTFPPINPLFESGPGNNAFLFLPETTMPLDWLRLYPGLFALRLTSALLGALTVVCIWGIASTVWPDEPMFAVLAAATVTFIPQFIYINSTIRNDCATYLVASAAIWLLARLVARPGFAPQRKQLTLLGAGCAVGWLIKSTLLFVIPLTIVALALAYPRPRAWPAMLSWLAAPLVIGVGLYYLALPQARQGWNDIQELMRINPVLIQWSTVTTGLPLLRDSFWARFGWASVALPPLWTQVPTVLGLTGIGLSVVVVIRGIHAKRSPITIQQLAILILALGLVVAAFIRFNLATFQPQGRYLFPAIGVLAFLTLWGPWQLTGKWGRRLMAGGIIGGLALLNLISCAEYIYPAYYKAILPSAFQGAATEIVGEIYGQTTYGQTFIARYPNLNRVDVKLATYDRENHSPVVFHLRRGSPDEAGPDIFTLKVQPSDIADDAFYSFVFPVIPDSQGQTFYFYLQSPRSMPGDAFTIWATPDDAYPEGTRTWNGRRASGDLCFLAYSDLKAEP